MNKLNEFFNFYLPLVANSAIALILAALNLDRGFMSHFPARVQSPLVVALLTASYALTLVAAWFFEDIEEEAQSFALTLIGLVGGAILLRAFLTITRSYVPILSPLTLAPLLWALWPICVIYLLSTGPLSAWSAYPAVQFGLAVLAIIMYAAPAMTVIAGNRFEKWISRRKEEAEKRELIFKDATTTHDYVYEASEIPDREKAIKMLEHDMKVAMKYGDGFKANEILKALHYIELQDALGQPLNPKWADWRREALEKRRREPIEERKPDEGAEGAERTGLNVTVDRSGDGLWIRGAEGRADYIAYFRRSADPRTAMSDLQHDVEVARERGDEARFREISAAIKLIIERYGDVLRRGTWRTEEEFEAERREAERRRREAERRRLLDDLKSLKVFEGIVGLDAIKKEIVWSFLLPLFFPEEAEGVKPSGGILIYGPTGTGKTEVMKALFDACRRLKLQVLEAKPSGLVSKWVGETEQNIRNLFEKARERPTVLFIDEADGLLARRKDWEGSYEQRALKEFLQQMDGLKENEKILVIACTNEPWKIADPALRPGRLGTHFYAPPPGDKERAELFRLFLRGMRVDGEVDCDRLAEITKPSQRGYYCGADIKAICERAYIIALQSGRKALTMADLEAAAARTQPSISTAAVQEFENFMGRYTPSNTPPPSTEYIR